MNKLMFFWLGVKTFFCTCQPDHKLNDIEKIRGQYKISKIGKLSPSISESSGLIWRETSKSFYTMNDSGGEPILYEIDSKGKEKKQLRVANAVNKDWEDLAAGNQDTIFIGDFGNNSNSRKDLSIYLASSTDSSQNEIDGKKIKFKYEDQTAFPPNDLNMNFDCEAFFYSNGKLYLFSKNRSKKNHFVKLYTLNSQPGEQTAVLQDSINISTQVTSADISPDGKTFVLLTYGKILLFEIKDGIINFRNPAGCFRFSHLQTEAIAFVNNTDMAVTNEQGKLFLITRK